MPKCVIDGKEIEFQPGQNLIEVAKSAGIEIPYFCYHPGLSVVAQCRMCSVEIEKVPKLQTACSTPATDGMVVKTGTERVRAAQRSTMEFLLVNHPLDCPICDKAGECDLQDNSFGFGDSDSRYTEERRTYLDLDMGPVIQKNMNRCIHCTRCIRFGSEIAGIREMVALQRGNCTEIATIDGRPLETEYAGCYSDVCPTGSLTLKDFRFKKRAWFLKKTATICEGCSRGCNMETQSEGERIYRCVPLPNPEVNRHWMCDEGRFNYKYLSGESRVVRPRIRVDSSWQEREWSDAVSEARKLVRGKKVAFLVGEDLTLEEAGAIREFAGSAFPGAEVLRFGTPGVSGAADDADADKILKRKSKTANLQGLERLGIKPFRGLASGTETVLLFRGGRATLPKAPSVEILGFGVFTAEESAAFRAVFPGAAFAEKDGTVVNFQGREQKFRRAIRPPGESRLVSEALMLWLGTRG